MFLLWLSGIILSALICKYLVTQQYVYIIILYCTYNSLYGCVVTLIPCTQHGAQVNTIDAEQQSPLFRACERGHTEVMMTLLQSGADVNLADSGGRTPLHWYYIINQLQFLSSSSSTSLMSTAGFFHVVVWVWKKSLFVDTAKFLAEPLKTVGT